MSDVTPPPPGHRPKAELLYLSALHQTAAHLVGRRDLREVLESIAACAAEAFDTRHGWVHILDSRQGAMILRAGVGLFAPYVGDRNLPGRGIVGRVWMTGRPMTVDDYDRWEGRGRTLPTGSCRALCAVPLTLGDRIVGVMGVGYACGEPGEFAAEDLELLASFAELAALAVDQTLLREDLRRRSDERRCAEATLIQSERKFRAVFEESAEAIYIAGRDDRLEEANRAARRMLGLRPEQVPGFPLESAYVQPKVRRELLRRLEIHGAVRDYPVQVRHRDGTVVDGLETVTLRRSADGRIVGWQGIIRDTTPWKQTERALRESEEKFRTLAEQALLGIVIIGGDRIVFINDAAVRMLGRARVDLESRRGAELVDLFHPDDRSEVAAQIDPHHVGTATGRLDGEFRVVAASGEVRWLSVRSQRISYEGATAVELALLDVTAHRLTEEELRTRYAFEQLVTGISTRFVNIAPERLDEGIRTALEEIGRFAGVDRTYVLAFSPETGGLENLYEWCAEGVPPRLAQLYRSDNIHQGWLEWVTRQGVIHISDPAGLHPVEREEMNGLITEDSRSLVVVPMLFGGAVLGALGLESVRRNITWTEDSISLLRTAGEALMNALERRRVERALKNSQAQLIQAQKMEAVGQLAGGVAHDFNNILTVISGQAELMMMELNPLDPLRRNVEEIQKASERAATLIRHLLAFSRQQAMELQVVDLNEAVADMERMLLRLIGEDLELAFDPAPDLWSVRVDRGQFQQVVVNLVLNARDALASGGTIRITTSNCRLDESFTAKYNFVVPGEYVAFSVSDNGVGIPEEIRSRIFDPFFTTKEPGKGTGLGLSMVYGIVKQFQGYIIVDSEPGLGSTFTIYLPRAAEKPEPAAVRGSIGEGLPGGTETVLVVEDEDTVRRITVNILSMAGYTVYEAENGEEALRKCADLNRPVDLVLTDVVMPRMSGTELARQLEHLYPGIKIIFISGYTTESVIQKGLLNPASHCLPKPFRLGTLLNKVREVLDEKPTAVSRRS